MQIIKDTADFRISDRCAVAIGKFDGVHPGHRLLIQNILKQEKEGLVPTVFTFDPDPASLFAGRKLRALTLREEKRRILEELGVSLLLEFPMTAETAAIKAEDFITEYLHERMNTAYVTAGPDLTFGDKGSGNVKLLSETGEKLGMKLELVKKLEINGEEISSSNIKLLLSEGRVMAAKNMLGRTYTVGGTVVCGRHLGSTIGFPTANFFPDEGKFLPKNGVYITEIKIGGINKSFLGISNIGTKPTVQETPMINIETNIADFSEDIYGRELEIGFLEYLRPETKFDGIGGLREQLKKDRQSLENYKKQI